jgi:hypothetical protein
LVEAVKPRVRGDEKRAVGRVDAQRVYVHGPRIGRARLVVPEQAHGGESPHNGRGYRRRREQPPAAALSSRRRSDPPRAAQQQSRTLSMPARFASISRDARRRRAFP